MNDYTPNFIKAFNYVILNEGPKDNDPTDHGGLTHWGITQEFAAEHRCPVHPKGIDVQTVDQELAKHMYFLDVWAFEAIKDIRIAIKLFDYGVLESKTTSITLAQRACNRYTGPVLTVDGILGPQTIFNLNSIDPLKFLNALSTISADYYCDIVQHDFIKTYGLDAFNKRQLKYIKGWIRRAIKQYY